MYFGNHYANFSFIMDVMISLTIDAFPVQLSVDGALERLQNMDDEEFAYIFLGLSAFDYDRSMLRDWIENPDTLTEETLGVQRQFLSRDDVRFFLRDIGGMKNRLSRLISSYWETCFAAEWPTLETYFEQVVKKEELILQRSSYLQYIDGLHEDLLVKDGKIVFHKNPDYEVAIDRLDRLVILLSVFNAPHLSGNLVGRSMDVVKNLNFHSAKLQGTVQSDIRNIIFAASDETRLRIMKILWNSDATTKEIAEVLELSPSTISIHLKILKEADLVETNKIKKYVYYRLKKDAFYTLQDGLLRYFEY
jgi:DNA-binding transcriptional ArsR family regulator